jgi:HAD superfamily hydrolase (TIGR01509 family)
LKTLHVVVELMLKALIFDLDGVIMRFGLDSQGIKQEVITFLEGKGLPMGALTPTDPFSRIKEGARAAFLSQGRDEGWINDVLKEADKIPIRREVEAAEAAEVLPGVRETMPELKGRGFKLAIFTYNNSLATGIALSKNGLDRYFELIAARDSVPRPKPNPLHLAFVLEGLMVGKEEALVIGDSEMDIRPCKELGVRVAAITTGIRNADFLRSLEPDYLIGSLPELIPIADSLRQS